MQGADTAIQLAAQRGYEAVIIVITMLAMIAMFGLIIRWFLRSTDKRLDESARREERLAARITVLESFVENTLLGMARDIAALMAKNVETIDKLSTTLNSKLCLLSNERQDVIVNRLGDRIGERLVDNARKTNLE